MKIDKMKREVTLSQAEGAVVAHLLAGDAIGHEVGRARSVLEVARVQAAGIVAVTGREATVLRPGTLRPLMVLAPFAAALALVLGGCLGGDLPEDLQGTVGEIDGISPITDAPRREATAWAVPVPAELSVCGGAPCSGLCVHWQPWGDETCEPMPVGCGGAASCACAGSLCEGLICDGAGGGDLTCFYGTTTP